jgi:hypothetical protein
MISKILYILLFLLIGAVAMTIRFKLYDCFRNKMYGEKNSSNIFKNIVGTIFLGILIFFGLLIFDVNFRQNVFQFFGFE